ncbi:MAG: hypothetical protein LBT55_03470 [Clostridiaceae bacterium]|jgi:hypothetical protein|nr:hypothetical protein [Clostridiaceae bacterium]
MSATWKKALGIAVLVVLITASVLGIYFYVNAFKINNLNEYFIPENEIVIYNYKEYQISERNFIATTIANGVPYIDDNVSYEITAVFSPAVKNGDFLTADTVIGKDSGGTDIKAGFTGRVLSVSGDSEEKTVTALNYGKTSVFALVNPELAGRLKVGQIYSTSLNRIDLVLELKAVRYNPEVSDLQCEFTIVDGLTKETYIFADSVFDITIKIDAYKMLAVEKGVLAYKQFQANSMYSVIIKDEKNFLGRTEIFCAVIGDSYIGISGTWLEGKSLCIPIED